MAASRCEYQQENPHLSFHCRFPPQRYHRSDNGTEPGWNLVTGSADVRTDVCADCGVYTLGVTRSAALQLLPRDARYIHLAGDRTGRPDTTSLAD
jgi:hypothetical protein